MRERGHVQWFKSDKGDGRIISDRSGDELFVSSAVSLIGGPFQTNLTDGAGACQMSRSCAPMPRLNLR